ncbi:MAG: 3-hydroxyacyl-CoA dehydrogenase/enoyl-CoA hydratase family protein [Desulforhopalus sp.]
MYQINQAAVLGAGVMGATIAAHLANAGLDVLMLDMVPKKVDDDEQAKGLTLDSPAVRNRLAASGLRKLTKMKPAPLYRPAYVRRIQVGNFDDDLEKIEKCEWVIEVVVEYMPIKLELLKKVVPHLGSGAILTTNTSGLSVNEMAEVLPEEIKKRFFATHFFNPPRYMRLMELVPCQETDATVLQGFAEFASKRLGKGVVHAKDTTNFIANRIGTYAIYKSMAHMVDMGMTVEEVDVVAGPATARPKSAAFRTADLVGLDTLAHVGNNSHDLLEEDEEREVFRLPDFMKKMIDDGLLGNKAGRGFYKKENIDGKKTISYYDYTTGEYTPLEKPKFPSLQAAKQVDDPGTRLKMVLGGKDKGSEFAWKSLRDTLLYACRRIPEIADDVVNIDNAMRWGFNWEIGPFEMFDAIGIKNFVERAENDGIEVPENLHDVETFYRINEQGEKEYFDLLKKEYGPVPVKKGQLSFDILKKTGAVVEKNANCSLIDLGDGVFGFEFHSKMNAISGDILAMTHKAVKRAEEEGVGLVIGNHGANFSVGANLMMLAVTLAEGAFDDLNMAVRAFQKATMALKYAKIPVVAAPFGMTLGGGAEYCLHSDAITACGETYMGLVEVGVGLLPAGGGTKEMCLRAVKLAERYNTDVQPFIVKHFEQIAMAKVSTAAAELYGMNYMRNGDSVTMDLDRLLGDAKQKVLALAANYRPGRPAESIPAPGRDIAAVIKSRLWNMMTGNFITAYEAEMGAVIAQVLCGGDVNPGTLISEEYLLELERENFLKLCGNKQTSERIQHMLKTGKPLRN